MHLSTIIMAALPVLAAAQTGTNYSATATTSGGPTASPSPSGYTVMSLRSASPIHFLQMNAAGLRFYLGGQTNTSCAIAANECPPGNETVFTYPYNGLSIEVPGGQELYVTPQGQLGYTQAHSAYYPPGSVLDPLTYTPVSDAAFEAYVGTTAFNATGFMACPTANQTSTASWQVYAAMANATVPSGNINDCLGFDAVALSYDGPLPAAWQYD